MAQLQWPAADLTTTEDRAVVTITDANLNIKSKECDGSFSKYCTKQPQLHPSTMSDKGFEDIRSVDSAVSDVSVSTQKLQLQDTSLPPVTTEAVDAPFHYICSLPSKGVRNRLANALNVWLDVPTAAVENAESIVGNIHNVSLMLDDVQDNSALRRGQPATHTVFGMPQTVNSATYHLVDITSSSVDLGKPDVVQAVAGELKNLIAGQGLDLFWTHNVTAPSVEEYLRMVDGKTGSLFRLILKLMVPYSNLPSLSPTRFDRLMTLLGRYFQIRDDYANLVSAQYTKNKGHREDLDEGKYSFILIHALENADSSARSSLCSMLMERRVKGFATDSHKDFIWDLLKDVGSFEYTADALRSLMQDLVEEISSLESQTGIPNPEMRQILESLKL